MYRKKLAAVCMVCTLTAGSISGTAISAAENEQTGMEQIHEAEKEMAEEALNEEKIESITEACTEEMTETEAHIEETEESAETDAKADTDEIIVVEPAEHIEESAETDAEMDTDEIIEAEPAKHIEENTETDQETYNEDITEAETEEDFEEMTEADLGESTEDTVITMTEEAPETIVIEHVLEQFTDSEQVFLEERELKEDTTYSDQDETEIAENDRQFEDITAVPEHADGENTKLEDALQEMTEDTAVQTAQKEVHVRQKQRKQRKAKAPRMEIRQVEGASEIVVTPEPSWMTTKENAEADTSHVQMEVQLTGADGEVIETETFQSNDGTLHMRLGELEKAANRGKTFIITAMTREEGKLIALRKQTVTVNQDGSLYVLADETAAMLQTHTLKAAEDVVLREVNRTPVVETRLMLSHNGELRMLASEEYETVCQGTSDGYEYVYTVPAKLFHTNGSYELILITEDRNGKRTDSFAQKQRICFIIDDQAPEALLLEQPSDKGTQWEVLLRDDFAINKVSVWIDGKETPAEKEMLSSSEMRLRLRFQSSGEQHQIRLEAEDEAGNCLVRKEMFGGMDHTEKLPVRKAAFPGLVAGLYAALLGSAEVLKKKWQSVN